MRKLALLFALFAVATPAGAAPLPTLNDEFDDPGTTGQWQVMQGDLADGVAPAFDIAKTTPGELTITPLLTSCTSRIKSAYFGVVPNDSFCRR